MTTLSLPLPVLTKGRFASLDVYTDESLFEICGVRIAFTTRQGGVSAGPYASLNLGSHVDDDLALVEKNRKIVLSSLSCGDAPLIVPKQVHGDRVLSVSDAKDVRAVAKDAAQGADGVVVGASRVAALLCFADCIPVIIVSPTGRFAVVHAGWRGVENLISAKAVGILSSEDACALGEGAPRGYNVYIGAHIRSECFETGPDVHERFVSRFGPACAPDDSHVDLLAALKSQLMAAGVADERICDLGACTVCRNDEFFSFRAQDGVTGRHGAFACRVS